LVLDGEAHQLHVDGGVELADPAIRTPFAVITRFVPHITREVATRTTGTEFAELLSSLVPSQNYLYAVRVTGRFALADEDRGPPGPAVPSARRGDQGPGGARAG
jgi:acetolactate decarboxylase